MVRPVIQSDRTGRNIDYMKAFVNVYDDQAHVLRTGLTLEGDIEIGAVEIKDGDSDQRASVNSDGSLNAVIKTLGQDISVQNPIPTDSDSVYIKDIWTDQSTSINFSGVITDLFDNLHSQIINNSSDNPKTLFIHFNRTVVSNAIGLGSAISGDFSNVKIEIVNSGGVYNTVVDESASSTKYTSRTFQLPVTAGFNALRITFHTADAITLSNCVILKTIGVVSRLQGVKNDGTVVDFNATNAGNFKTSLEEFDETFYTSPLPVADFGTLVSQGRIVGNSFVSKFGQNESLGTGAFEDIWDGGGTYVYPADGTAPIVKLIGHNAADTEPIEVQGLDINGDLVIQTKTLTGLTAVTLDTPLWRVFRLKNVGTSDLIDDVCAINTGDTQDYACINNGNNQTLMALYTIPAGKTGYLLQGSASIVGLTRAYSIDGHMYMRSYGSVFQLKNTFGLSSDGTSFFEKKYPLPLVIAEKTDIRVRAISSAANGVMNATFDILLVDN